MVGSRVWKPGDRKASLTSTIARPPVSLAVKGADGLEDIAAWLWEVEFAGTSGDEGGSFFTMILGGPCLALYMV